MPISKLLRFLLCGIGMHAGIVEVSGGGAAADPPEDEPDAPGEGEEGDEPAEGEEAEEAAAAAEAGDDAAAGDADLVVSLGDEPAAEEDDQARAPEWIRELRKSNREKDRRIRELEQKAQTAAPAQALVVGDEPTLESCDYDAEKFARDLKAWVGRKADADQQQRTREQSEAQQRQQWQGRIDAVQKAVSTLKVKDYDEAAEAFEDLFPSPVHRGIILGGPDDPKTSALLRYALGKNPKKARELAAITDPVKFAFAVAKLEERLKVTPRKAAPAPDTVVRSSVAGSAAIDSTLKRLQADADKSGDRTKVAAYIRQQKHKQAA
jgi:hypothetical protein